MERKVFPSKVAGDFINDKVVFFKHDTSVDGDAVLKKYNLPVIPMFLLFDGGGRELSRFSESITNVNEFKRVIGESLKPENYGIERLRRYREEPSYAPFYVDYLSSNLFEEEKNKCLEELFRQRSIEELFSKDWIEYYIKEVYKFESFEFQFILNNLKEVSKVLGKKEFRTFIGTMSNYVLHCSTLESNFDDLKKNIEIIEAYPVMQTDYSKFVISNSEVVVTKNIPELLKLISKSIVNTDSQSRDYLVRLIDRVEDAQYIDEIIEIYEKASLYEKDDTYRQMYGRAMGRLKNIRYEKIKL